MGRVADLAAVVLAYRVLVDAATVDVLSLSHVDMLRLRLLRALADRSMLLDGDALSIAAAVAAFPGRERLAALPAPCRYLAELLDQAERADRSAIAAVAG